MSIKYKQNGVTKTLGTYAAGVKVMDLHDHFQSDNVEEILSELAQGQGNVGSTAFADIAQNKADIASIKATNTTQDTNIAKNASDIAASNANIAQLSNPNLLLNGGFQIWQRGTSFTNVSAGTYVADRWQVFNQSSGNIVQQSNNAIRISPNGTTAWHCNIAQILDNSDTLMIRGKTVTFSMNLSYANASIMQVIIADGSTVYGSKTLVNGKNSITVTLPNVAFSKLRIEIAFMATTTDVTNFITIGDCKLEIGSVATPFSPRPYAEELAMCQRYYQKQAMTANMIQTNNIAVEASYKVPMRVSPTVTLSGNSLFCHNTAANVSFIVTSVNAQPDYLQNLVASNSNIVNGYNYSGIFYMDAEIY